MSGRGKHRLAGVALAARCEHQASGACSRCYRNALEMVSLAGESLCRVLACHEGEAVCEACRELGDVTIEGVLAFVAPATAGGAQ